MYCIICRLLLKEHTLTQLRECKLILNTEINRKKFLKQFDEERKILMKELSDGT